MSGSIVAVRVRRHDRSKLEPGGLREQPHLGNGEEPVRLLLEVVLGRTVAVDRPELVLDVHQHPLDVDRRLGGAHELAAVAEA